jgi:hypothetical protein
MTGGSLGILGKEVAGKLIFRAGKSPARGDTIFPPA